jgi:uroporphyrinogen decarboxylase
MSNSSLFLDALFGKNSQRAPVWLMRQAGRYMPSYQKIREGHTLLEMFTTKDLIIEVTKLPIDELGVDAAIIFSDILLPLSALGYNLTYEKKEGPQVFHKSLAPLHPISQEELKKKFCFLFDAIKELKSQIKVPLIGFCGAPFTLLSYILEEKSHHLLKKTKESLYKNPKDFHEALEVLANVVIEMAKLQFRAGCEVIQIFDSWAGALDYEEFENCSTFYLKKIVTALKEEHIPVILFSRGSSYYVDQLASLNPTAISFDWYKPLDEIAKVVPQTIALQGSFDPDFLKGSKELIQSKVNKVLTSMKKERRYIVNLGHGITPEIPYESVKYFVDLVKNFTI